MIGIIGIWISFSGYLLTIPQFNRVFLGYSDSTKTIIKHEGWYKPRSIIGKFLRRRKMIGTIMMLSGFFFAMIYLLLDKSEVILDTISKI